MLEDAYNEAIKLSKIRKDNAKLLSKDVKNEYKENPQQSEGRKPYIIKTIKIIKENKLYKSKSNRHPK